MNAPAMNPPMNIGFPVDRGLLAAFVGLLALGLVLVGSASFGIAEKLTGNPFHFLIRQAAYVAVGLALVMAAVRIPMHVVRQSGPWLLLATLFLLIFILIPGMGRSVHGGTRWIDLGLVNVQVVELAKLFVIVYLGGYLVRQGEAVRTQIGGFLKPMILVALICVLLIMQPDFGASVVLLLTVLAMMFLGGVRLWQFGLLFAVCIAVMALLAVLEPYRLSRITVFMNPWADPYDSGFQLVQALIAIGRGEWFGVGLGESVQKLFYLPEAHTDFLYAVLTEELGMAGALTVLGLYGLLTVRIFAVARRAEAHGGYFNAFVCWGVGVWLSLQAFINIGVNMGLLPTKGLTLPFMSYGGSSMLVSCLAMGLVLRVDYENARAPHSKRGRPMPDLRSGQGSAGGVIA